MDQKNTIVKCNHSPKCLFEHNGVCDNYVINIGADGQCESYIETELVESVIQDPVKIGLAFKEISKQINMQRGQRAKYNIYDDATFNLCSAACHYYDFKGACLYCQLRQEYLGPERLMKPCDLFVKAENDKSTVKMKLIQLNELNKNKTVISDWAYAATPDICKICKKVVYGQPCEYKNVANGVWACYEIDETIKKAGTLNECWWCDFFNSEKRKCKHKDPDIDKFGCHSSQSTGGNR